MVSKKFDKMYEHLYFYSLDIVDDYSKTPVKKCVLHFLYNREFCLYCL